MGQLDETHRGSRAKFAENHAGAVHQKLGDLGTTLDNPNRRGVGPGVAELLPVMSMVLEPCPVIALQPNVKKNEAPTVLTGSTVGMRRVVSRVEGFCSAVIF